jgi:hypothetical protein
MHALFLAPLIRAPQAWENPSAGFLSTGPPRIRGMNPTAAIENLRILLRFGEELLGDFPDMKLYRLETDARMPRVQVDYLTWMDLMGSGRFTATRSNEMTPQKGEQSVIFYGDLLFEGSKIEICSCETRKVEAP